MIGYDDGDVWRRLDRRTLVVELKWLIPPVLATVFYELVTIGHIDHEALTRLGFLTATFVMILVYRVVQLLTTRYRVVGELFEVRTGLVARHHRSIPCDRIRRVDLIADPFHRVLGLSVVKIATAQHSSMQEHEIKLEALRGAEARQLRRRLLTQADPQRAQTHDEADSDLIAQLDWSWIRYAPLTIWGVVGIAILTGAVLRVLDGLGVRMKAIFALIRLLGMKPLWVTVVVGVLVLIVLGAITAMAAFVEEWWKYQLRREDDGTFGVHRGLLTTRSLSLDWRRLRGIEVAEPLLLRMGGGAHVVAVATGLQQSEGDELRRLKVLTPGMPRAEAHEVAGVLIGQRPSPTQSSQLATHPRAAFRRRLVRAVVAVSAVCAAVAVAGAFVTPVLFDIAWVLAVVLLPLAALLAVDAYRGLGHGIRGRYLITRYGTFGRRTVALERDGVIGWKVVRSPTQRWAGLATIVATTAAGQGAYKVRDVKVGDGLAFADESVPGLLAPFLERG